MAGAATSAAAQAPGEFLLGGPPPDDPAPHICPIAPNTPTFDLGHYRGVWRVLRADGTPLERDGAWHACPPRKADEKPWDDCGFSLCHAPDGEWRVQFSPLPSPDMLRARLRDGRFEISPDTPFKTPFGGVIGDYGFDATAAPHPVLIALGGFAGRWRVDGWPAPGFTGTDTAGRGEALPPGIPPAAGEGAVTLRLFPATTYGLRFGDGPLQTLSLKPDGTPVLPTPSAFRDAGPLWPATRLTLRTGAITLGAPGLRWRVDGKDMSGRVTLRLPALSAWPVAVEQRQGTLTLDAACAPHIDGLALPASGGGCAAAQAPGRQAR